jgi:hypothetical protein
MPEQIDATVELRSWLSGFGDVSAEAGTPAGQTRIRLAGVDRGLLNAERRRLLAAWVRRMSDERQVGCAMTRVMVERQRRTIEATSAWVAGMRRRDADPTG